MNRPGHLLIDFMIHLFLALALFVMLPVGIVLMLIFTAVDAASRAIGRLRKAWGSRHG